MAKKNGQMAKRGRRRRRTRRKTRTRTMRRRRRRRATERWKIVSLGPCEKSSADVGMRMTSRCSSRDIARKMYR